MAARPTALGLERDGKRVALIAGHRDGITVRVDPGAYTLGEAEHLIALLTEQVANARIKAETKDAA